VADSADCSGELCEREPGRPGERIVRAKHGAGADDHRRCLVGSMTANEPLDAAAMFWIGALRPLG
jgi:hypothetical protein